MEVINEEELLKALNAAEGTWQETPFPEDKIPEGHTAKAIQGTVNGRTFLCVRYTTPTGAEGFDGTCVTISPFAMIHVPPGVAKAAFLKGIAWIEKHK